MQIFQMFLSSAFEWGVGKTIDVITKCFRCKEKQEARIANVQFNDIFCSNCKMHVKQFTNACPGTINKRSNEIGQAAIWKGSNDFDWVNSDGHKLGFFSRLFAEKNKNGIPLTETNLQIVTNFRVIGMKNRSLVKYVIIKDYETEYRYVQVQPQLIKINSNNYLWKNFSVNFSPQYLQNIWANQILSVQICLKTEYKEVIAEEQRSIIIKS